MKNWCKIYEFDEFDMLVKKDYSEEEDMVTIDASIYDDSTGITAKTRFMYKNEEERDRIFDKDNREGFYKLGVTLIKSAQ